MKRIIYVKIGQRHEIEGKFYYLRLVVEHISLLKLLKKIRPFRGKVPRFTALFFWNVINLSRLQSRFKKRMLLSSNLDTNFPDNLNFHL